jgi:hypothetical protein
MPLREAPLDIGIPLVDVLNGRLPTCFTFSVIKLIKFCHRGKNGVVDLFNGILDFKIFHPFANQGPSFVPVDGYYPFIRDQQLSNNLECALIF